MLMNLEIKSLEGDIAFASVARYQIKMEKLCQQTARIRTPQAVSSYERGNSCSRIAEMVLL